MKSKIYSTEIGGSSKAEASKTITAEFNDLADQAHGSVIVRMGNTVVLATVVMSKLEKETDYFPLSVEYEERFYASGQILGSRFQRREGRPSDDAVLSGRIVDRTIRPLFDHTLRNEVQVIITTLSLDEYDPDVLAVTAASLALGTSHIPWNGPVSAVRIGKLKGSDELLVNPTYKQRNPEAAEPEYELDMVVCGRDGTINMIEVASNEASEETVLKALELAAKELDKLQKFQEGIIKEIGVKKSVATLRELSPKVSAIFDKEIAPLIKGTTGEAGKKKIYELEEKWLNMLEAVPEEGEEKLDKVSAKKHFHDAINDFIHDLALKDDKRYDGRGFEEVRNLFAKAGGISPVLHGSGIFYRGGTHILSVLTLGAPSDSQIIDGMETQENKRYMHHYNFPPYSGGETGRVGSTNRRMIGHGALAEKALLPVLPPKEEFPYTIRIVSEALASNGSTSMASVCGSTLALMDGGVPIKKPVAGIASGLLMSLDSSSTSLGTGARDKISGGNFKYKILTDIQGPEDEYGDMDFKVAGTRDGITAVQMDVKVDGIPLPILKEAFDAAKAARLQILDVMMKEIVEPRADLSSRAPRILVTKIKPDQIGLVIGTGGKNINEIKDLTGAQIDIEEDGTVYITGESVGANQAKKLIEDMTHEYKAGERVEGVVVRVADFGVIVELNKHTDGMVHVSEMAPFRIDRVERYIKLGMKVPILVKGLDDKGRLKLSIKDADSNFIKQQA
jgi:polyribonucleotide nucleotidyltransferase